MMRHDTVGRRLLQRVLLVHTRTEVAAVCRVKQPAVSKWALGYQRPSESARRVLETRYKIHHWAWYQIAESVNEHAHQL